MDGAWIATDLTPVSDFATENARQLKGIQLSQRIAGMQNHCNAVDGNGLLAGCTFQIPQTRQIFGLLILDRSRRGCDICVTCFQCGKTGA